MNPKKERPIRVLNPKKKLKKEVIKELVTKALQQKKMLVKSLMLQKVLFDFQGNTHVCLDDKNAKKGGKPEPAKPTGKFSRKRL